MRKVISILLVICLLIMPSGCSSNKTLTMQKASRMMKWNKCLVLHTPKQVYDLYNYDFKKNVLVGHLRNNSKHRGNIIHVYTDQELIIDPSSYSNQKVSIEKSDIGLIYLQKNTTLTISIISILIILCILFPGEGTGFFDKQSM